MQTSRGLMNRMVRAARLEVDLYEEVEADTAANGQAFLAVLVASVAAGVGAGIAGAVEEGGPWFLWGLLLGLGTALIGWVAWSVLAYWLGTTIFRGPETSATYGELLRTIGFSNSPRVLAFFVFIPFFGGLIALCVAVWALVAGVIAVRQALDFSTGRAIGTCIVGWIIYQLAVFLVVGLVIGGSALV
ncbi:YIP1 family protein [Chloroflexota bacterium]